MFGERPCWCLAPFVAVKAASRVKPGRPIDVAAYPIAGQTGWRLMFDIDAPAGAVVDMRAFLRKGGQALTETWIAQAGA